jgi:PAS domain S-box-containing protein
MPVTRLSSEQFAAAMQHSPIGTALVALDGKWLWTNVTLRSLLGYDEAEFGRTSFQAVTHPDDLQASLEHTKQLLDGKSSAYQMEKRYIRHDRSLVWCLLTVSLVRDATGRPDYFIAKIQDISQRKADEVERAALTERLALATRAGGVGVWEWEIATDALILDEQMFELYGRDQTKLAPGYDDLFASIQPDYRGRVAHEVAEALAGRSAFDTEFPIDTSSGKVRHIRAIATVVRDASGTAMRMIGTNWDVTAEKRLSAVQHEKNRFRAAVQAVQGVLWTNDAAGRMVGEQPGWAALTGQGFADYQGHGWTDAVHPEDVPSSLDAWNEAVAEQRTFIFEHRVRRYDGAWRIFAIRAVPMLDLKGDLVEWVGVHTDITDQRQAEAELRSANVQLKQIADEFGTLAEGMAELCWIAQPDGHIFWYNQHWYEYTGTVAADMEGWGWQSVHDPKVLPAVLERWTASISSGKAFEMTFPLRGADGHFRPFLTRIAPVLDAEGKVRRWLGINVDVSKEQEINAELERRVDARTAELKEMAQQLEKARNVAEESSHAKSRFLAGMSHELRTPLNGILGYAQLLRLEGGLNVTQGARIDAMLGAGKHLLGMITCVLDMSEIEAGHLTLQLEEIDLPDLAGDCLDVVAAIANGKGLSLDLSTGRGIVRNLVTDPTRLRQVLLNLLGNALKFTTEGGVELRLRCPAAGAGLRIEVADTGPGIPAALRPRLFRDFERLNARANASIEGSGLGLAFSAKLIALMGGRIGYDDEPGGGSLFWIELPLAAGGLSPRLRASKTGLPASTGTARQISVLVTDDVAINREIAQAFLRNAGHQVTRVSGGAEAVAAAAADDFDIILMDVSMPGMDGLEATRRIRNLPGPRGLRPIIGVTAHAFAEQIADCLDAGMNAHLAKPFTHEELSTVVSRALAIGPAQPTGFTNTNCNAASHRQSAA